MNEIKKIILVLNKFHDEEWMFWPEEKYREEVIKHNPNFSKKKVEKSIGDLINLKISKLNDFLKFRKMENEVKDTLYSIRKGSSNVNCICGYEELKESYIIDFKKETTIYDYKGIPHTGKKFMVGSKCVEAFL